MNKNQNNSDHNIINEILKIKSENIICDPASGKGQLFYLTSRQLLKTKLEKEIIFKQRKEGSIFSLSIGKPRKIDFNRIEVYFEHLGFFSSRKEPDKIINKNKESFQNSKEFDDCKQIKPCFRLEEFNYNKEFSGQNYTLTMYDENGELEIQSNNPNNIFHDIETITLTVDENGYFISDPKMGYKNKLN